MTRTLRGAWSRRWTLLPLLLLTVVVVGGTVGVLTFAESAGTSASLAVPLLVLGAVAVPVTARELAEARRPELALARLRGTHGGQLSALAGAEPLLVLLSGGVLGLVVGGLGGQVALAVLAPSADPVDPGLRAVAAGAAIVVVGLVAVLAGMSQTLGEPLSEQVRSARRPRPSGVAALAFVVLVAVAAVVASYRASVAGADPDLLVLAAPALVGLAVGQVAVGGLQLLARLLVGLTRGRGLGGFLAVRRLARVADVATPLRLVVAAATVATLAGTGALQVGRWSDETARLRAGAPFSATVEDGSADTALRVASSLDPEGRWLMAAAFVPGTGSAATRRAYLDLARYDAVFGDFYGATPVAAAEPAMHDLIQVSGQNGGGEELVVGARGVSSRADGVLRVSVTVEFASAARTPRTAAVRFEVPRDGSESVARAPLPGCDQPCVLTGVSVLRDTGTTTPLPFVLSRLDFGSTDALDLDWVPAAEDTGGRVGGLLHVDGGLLARSGAASLGAVPSTAAASLPVLATDSTTWDGEPTAESPGGDDRGAVLVGRAAALPMVEADGLLIDLPTAQVGSAPTVPAAEVSVLAAADTPASVRAALEEATGSPLRSLADVEEATEQETRATQAAVYAVMAVACLLIALLALATASASQRAAWRRDAAALRVVGVPTETLGTAARLEVLLLAVTAALGTLVGGVLAVRLLLSHLALARVPEHSVALRTAVEAGPASVGALAATVVVVLAVGWGRTVGGRRSRPAILREEATP